MTVIAYTRQHIGQTLTHLHDSGNLEHEGIVLWLGRRVAEAIVVEQILCPTHTAKADMFWIGPEGMAQIKDAMRSHRLMVAAQVHSHPASAFHSEADDKWAIVRHVGAISIVLPDFALKTTPATFVDHAKTFCLTPANHWQLVPTERAIRCL